MPVAHERFDLFICHASEDKDEVARPLARALLGRGLKVWLDELELTIGDSLNGRIEAGLARSRFGVVVISPAFFAKEWPQRELAGLAAREVDVGAKVILPVWHDVDRRYIARRAPILADRLGAQTSAGLQDVADKILLALRRADEFDSHAASPEGRAAYVPSASVPDGSGRRRAQLGAAALAVVFAATIGYWVVPERPGADMSRSLSSSAATQAIEVSFPSNWKTTTPDFSAPGIKLIEPMALRTAAKGTLAIGRDKSVSATLLPTGLLSVLSRPPRREAIRLGTTNLYRYRHLETKDGAGVGTIYAWPTSAGIFLGICMPPKRSPTSGEADCERILGSQKLASASSITLGPQPAYAATLSRAFSRLNAVRAEAGARLAQARTPAAQASAAALLAGAHEHAAMLLRKADSGPAEQHANDSIATALVRVAGAYSAMATGARAQDQGRFEWGRTEVHSATAQLVGAIATLSSFGYQVAR